MRKNEIRNEGKNRCVGFLFYYEKSDTCVIELSPEVKAEEAPAWFRPFLEKKIFTLRAGLAERAEEETSDPGYISQGCPLLSHVCGWKERRSRFKEGTSEGWLHFGPFEEAGRNEDCPDFSRRKRA